MNTQQSQRPRPLRALTRQVTQLQRELAALRIANAPAPAAPARRRRTNRRRKRQAVPSVARIVPAASGEVTIGKLELCASIKVEKNKSAANGSCQLLASTPPFLKTLSKSFERIRWNLCKVHYKPAVAMTQGGLITVGMDWNWSDAKTTRSDLSSYQPTATSVVWKEFSMVLPPARLQSRLWYSTGATALDKVDAGPGIVVWAVDTAADASSDLVVGELWLEYRVVLSGTTA